MLKIQPAGPKPEGEDETPQAWDCISRGKMHFFLMNTGCYGDFSGNRSSAFNCVYNDAMEITVVQFH